MAIKQLLSNKINDIFYQHTLNEIFEEKDIRFAGFIDSEGCLIKGKFREDIVPFESDADQQKIFRELAYRVSTRKNFDYSMGQTYASFIIFSSSRRFFDVEIFGRNFAPPFIPLVNLIA